MTINEKHVLCCVPLLPTLFHPRHGDGAIGVHPHLAPSEGLHSPLGMAEEEKTQPVTLLPHSVKESTCARVNPKLWFKTYTESTVTPHTGPTTTPNTTNPWQTQFRNVPDTDGKNQSMPKSKFHTTWESSTCRCGDSRLCAPQQR